MSNGRNVTVCGEGVPAIKEPHFLLESGGKLYLTLAVLEYDPGHPRIKDRQKEAIAGLRDHLKRGKTLQCVQFASGEVTDEIIAANTSGPGPIGQGVG
jgi:hypothetical protein